MFQHSNNKNRDYFAELYVAGILGDAGWNIYFPKRDVGFDFIAVKELRGQAVIRPVQVKGKYPAHTKGDKTVYGHIGQLSQLHPEMVLALPYFPTDQRGVAPTCTAYMPRGGRFDHKRVVASRVNQRPSRMESRKLGAIVSNTFDYAGITLMESEHWSAKTTDSDPDPVPF